MYWGCFYLYPTFWLLLINRDLAHLPAILLIATEVTKQKAKLPLSKEVKAKPLCD
uniref:Uncharacterized protein n=1 Tax=Anguilla anguilla TaxID=7936 RepID=A0A0E9SQ77_ANGAN